MFLYLFKDLVQMQMSGYLLIDLILYSAVFVLIRCSFIADLLKNKAARLGLKNIPTGVSQFFLFERYDTSTTIRYHASVAI